MKKIVLPVVVHAGAPAVTDDKDEGFLVGMLWLDTTGDDLYFCNDNATGAAVWTAVSGGGGGSGTVTSVGLSLPSIITVTGSPVTTSGTLTGALANQTAKYAFLGPASGSAAPPSFRAIAKEDLESALEGALVAGTNVTITDNNNGTFTIAVSGGSSGINWASPVSVTGTTTLTSSAVNKVHLCTGTSSNYTITLPDSGMTAGDLVAFQMGNSTTLTKLVTLDATSGNLIDGVQTRIMWSEEVAILKWDGTNWCKIGGKSIPMVGAMHLSGNQTIPSSTHTKVTLNAITLSVGAIANTSTNEVTIRRANYYDLSAQLYFQGVASTQFILNARKNGSDFIYGESVSVATEAQILRVGPFPVLLASADVMTLYAFHNNASSRIIYGIDFDCQLVVKEIITW